MASPKHPRHFSDDFKRQTVKPHNAGKPMSGIMAEYDLGRSTVRKRITSINATGSPHAADNRTPDQTRVIELERENRRLRMEVGALKTSGADVRAKAMAMAANAGRCPVSAQCEILGVPRSIYHAMRSRADAPKAPDSIGPDVLAVHGASRGRCGSRKIKAALARSGKTVSRRRLCRLMRDNGSSGACVRKKFKVHPGKPNEADASNIVARGFRGRAPRTHACSSLTYVRVGGGWNHVRLPIDLHNRETAGHSAGPRKDADLARSAFATLDFPISDIEALHTASAAANSTARRSTACSTPSTRGGRSPRRGVPTTTPWTNRPTRTEGRVRAPRVVREYPRVAGQAVGPRPLVQQLQDSLDAGLHEPGRVQKSGPSSLKFVQKRVANPISAAHLLRARHGALSRSDSPLTGISPSITNLAAESLNCPSRRFLGIA